MERRRDMFSINDYPHRNANTYHNFYPYNNQYIAESDKPRLFDRNARIEKGTMTLNGAGIIRVQPDIAIVVLGAISENMELRTAQQENAEKVRNIIDTLLRIGIEERNIETESYSVIPQYDYVEGAQVFRGYRVTNNLKVTIRDMDRVGAVVDAAVASGANVVYNVNFTISDPTRVYKMALSQAIVDAINKAITIERTLNIIVDKTPNTIEEESISTGIIRERDELFSPIATTPIVGGRIEVVARIKATFGYRKLLK